MFANSQGDPGYCVHVCTRYPLTTDVSTVSSRYLHMLPTNLVTNEVKDTTGTEVEFGRYASSDRATTFAYSLEAPNLPYRLKVQHQEIGTGYKRRRRSNIRIDRSIGGIDGQLAVASASITFDVPVGNITTLDDSKQVLANLISFLASKGTSTTILYDCSGYGAEALANGTL